MLSIVITTLNEEEYLPGLLNSIKEQNFNDLEIIVSDAGSKDKTAEIAKKYGCKVVKGGLPSVGKNNGAKKAKGNIIVFMDADMKLNRNELKTALKEFRVRELDVAIVQYRSLEKNFWGNVAVHLLYNIPVIILENILPHGVGFMLVKKEIFEKFGGFDEQLFWAEDHDFVRRVVKNGKYGVLRNVKPFCSLRRFEKGGWIKVSAQYLFYEIYVLIFGFDKKIRINYDLDFYKKH